MKPQLIVVLQFIMPVIGSALALAQPPVDRQSAAVVASIERTIVDAIARAEPSVVAVSRTATSNAAANADDSATNLFQDLRGSGSAESNSSITGAGVIIDRSGLVLTHYLAVRDGDEHTITTIDGKAYSATIRAADPRSALAVLAIQPASPNRRPANSVQPLAPPPSFQAVQLGDAQKLRKGQFVIAIGNPFGIQFDGEPTASWGIVTNLARKAPINTNLNDAPGPNGDYRTTLHHLGTLIQTDAKLGWSAAGAALINMKGELVGITTTAATIAGHEQPAGYAIPINATLQRIINTLKEGREVEYGMLGVSFNNISSDPGRGHHRAAMVGPRQVAIGDVLPGMPAALAGLQSGDRISRVDSQPVHDIDSMQLVVSMLPPATTTTIDYERGGRPASTKVTLAKLAVAGKKISTLRPESWHGLQVEYATALEGPELMQAISSSAYDAEGCVLVTHVEAESVAWRAGVRPGMFISHVGDRRVRTPVEFHTAARESGAGAEFDVRLTRQEETPPRDEENSSQDSDSLPTER